MINIYPDSEQHMILRKTLNNFYIMACKAEDFIFDQTEYQKSDDETKRQMRFLALKRFQTNCKNRYGIIDGSVLANLIDVEATYQDDDYQNGHYRCVTNDLGRLALMHLDCGELFSPIIGRVAIDETVRFFMDQLIMSQVEDHTLTLIDKLPSIIAYDELRNQSNVIKKTYVWSNGRWYSIDSYQHSHIFGFKKVFPQLIETLLTVKDQQLLNVVKERVMWFKLSHELDEYGYYIMDPEERFSFI